MDVSRIRLTLLEAIAVLCIGGFSAGIAIGFARSEMLRQLDKQELKMEYLISRIEQLETESALRCQ